MYLAVLLIPATKILRRTDYFAAWALVLLAPVVNLIATGYSHSRNGRLIASKRFDLIWMEAGVGHQIAEWEE